MSNNTITPTIAAGDTAEDTGYSDAQRLVARQQRKEAVAHVKELKRQADAAKQRAVTAQRKFEKTVAMLAADKPERVDWYEHPGVLPRKTLLEAAALSTVQLHRIMEKYRAGKLNAPRRAAARKVR